MPSGAWSTRVSAGFTAKGDAKSTVAIEHERLADAEEVQQVKAYWKERLEGLKRELET